MNNKKGAIYFCVARAQFEIEERAKLWPYLLIIAVSAIAVVGILLLVRPKTFSFLSRLRAQAPMEKRPETKASRWYPY